MPYYYLWCNQCKGVKLVKEKASGDLVDIICTVCDSVIRQRPKESNRTKPAVGSAGVEQ